jgi:predicted nucleotidyltransferase
MLISSPRGEKMQENMKQLMKEYRVAIEAVSDQHIQKVILYGSYARGDFRADSDIDVMILMDLEETSAQLKQYEEKIYDVTYDFNWDHNTEVMPVIKSRQQFDYWKSAYLFYQNVEREGVLI